MKTNRFILPILMLGVVASFFSCKDDNDNALEEGMGKRNSDVPQEVFYHCKITNAEELFSFAERVNKGEYNLNARLMNDIDISRRDWTPIARVLDNSSVKASERFSAAYNGVFNGNGHRIIGMKLVGETNDGAAFVGMLGPSGVVENVIFSHLDINAGVVVATICAYSQGELFACTALSGNVQGSSDVAGICAYNYGVIKRCFNQVTVRGEEVAAGICAFNKMGVVTECENSGEVVGVSNASVGGIVCVNDQLVINSMNHGKVRSGFPDTGIGGICGQNHSLVYNCLNDGEVEGGISAVGGICGKLQGVSSKAVLLNCISTGPVMPVKKEYVGAICGWSSGNCAVTDCYYGPERSQISDGLGGQPANYATMCTTIRNYLNKQVEEVGEIRVATQHGNYGVSMKPWKVVDKTIMF